MSRPAPEVKPYRRPMPRAWWLRHPRYRLYLLREISSVFIALWLVLLLVQVAQLGAGRQAYQGFVDGVLRSPVGLAFSVVTLAFALLHSITWHQLAGVVQVVEVGERRVPSRYVAAGAFGLWLVASLVVGGVMLAG